MEDCPFCQIKEQYQDRILEEREYVFVILSDPRLVPGHTLLIPKRHIETPSELSVDERKELFDAVLFWQEKIMNMYSRGCDIRQNCRPFQPQDWIKQNHVHFHLQPREWKDEIYHRFQVHERDMFQPLPEDEKAKFMRLFA